MMRPPTLLALVLLTSSLLAQDLSKPDPGKAATQIEELLAAYHAIDQFAGTALVAENGKIVYQGAFGRANEDWGIASDIDTKFRLASITKQFTAMLVLRLVADGKLELEAPILRYLPAYPAEAGNKITIHHLLNHTSGIPSYTNRPGFMQKDTLFRYSIDEFVAKYCCDPLEFEPGAEFRYSNSGYYLLGAIAEVATGKTYAEALREHIFDPLEMSNTGFDDQSGVIEKRATGYDEVLGERRLARWIDMSNAYSAGALYSTVGDLWKWDQALRARLLLEGRLEEQMFTPGLGNYGYGWSIDLSDPEQPKHRHSGGINGFSTFITRSPVQGRCVILLCNSSGSNVTEAAKGIGEILDGRSPRKPTPRTDVALARTVLDDGVEAGLGALRALPSELSNVQLERAINNLGYQLLGVRRIKEAVPLFDFNARAFPQSSNTWDSLGEAHMRAGNRRLAIESYRKALELDPSSTTAPPALERLEGSPEVQGEPPQPATDPYFQGTEEIKSTRGPNNITRSLAQDRAGKVWLATWEGIVGFDGTSFVNYTNRYGLDRFRAFSVLEDRSGRVWFGTVGAGVYRFDGNSFTHFTVRDGLVGNTILCIMQDRAGSIWFGTSAGISRHNGSSFHNLTTADGLPNDSVTTLMEAENGKVWIGTRGDACVYDGKRFVSIRHGKDGKPFTNVRSIVEESSGKIWLGGNDGLWSYDGTSFTHYLTNFIGNLFEDKKGNLWLSASEPGKTYEMSLCRYEGKPTAPGEAGLIRVAEPTGQVFGILEDAIGNIWFGTENGASYFNGEKLRHFKD